MNKAEIIKGIETTIEGLEAIKTSLMTEACDCGCDNTSEAPKSKSEARREKVQKEVPMNEPTEEVMVGKFDVEQLNSMKYNEFKKLASQLGVKCTGTREEIMERILALDIVITDGEAVVEEPQEEVAEAPTKSGKSKPSKKVASTEVEEPTTDEFDEQAEEIAKETPVEDIIEALKDVNIKATKKNAVTKLAQALRDGLIELDDEDKDDEDGEEATAEAVETEDEEIEAESYFAHLDPKGYNDPDEMSEERAEAVIEKMDSILTDYADGTLTDDDIAEFVEENATQEEIDLLGDEYDEKDILKLYMELQKRTIDNDGEEHEPADPYELGEVDMCCGHELKYIKKTKKYVCEQCGTEYEAE